MHDVIYRGTLGFCFWKTFFGNLIAVVVVQSEFVHMRSLLGYRIDFNQSRKCFCMGILKHITHKSFLSAVPKSTNINWLSFLHRIFKGGITLSGIISLSSDYLRLRQGPCNQVLILVVPHQQKGEWTKTKRVPSTSILTRPSLVNFSERDIFIRLVRLGYLKMPGVLESKQGTLRLIFSGWSFNIVL